MASLFNQDPGPQQPLDPYSRERIEKEVSHLRNRGSVRRPGEKPRRRSRVGWKVILFAGTLLWLFFMDPVLHALHRGDAIRAYLYLHHFGSEKKAEELLATGIFAPNEIALLNQRSGAFQDYYPGPGEGNRAADSVIRYLQGVTDLRNGDYEKLNWVGKIRYQLFVRFGLHPPTRWKLLDPAINH